MVFRYQYGMRAYLTAFAYGKPGMVFRNAVSADLHSALQYFSTLLVL
jgi:hypothetical protein